MELIENLKKKLMGTNRRIVFTEGPDPRILEATAKIVAEGLMTPILIGNVDEVKAAAQNGDGAAAKSAWAANHAHGQRSVLTVTPRAGSGVA